jgi:glycosyltransferase involved in cell wall biosynthesis
MRVLLVNDLPLDAGWGAEVYVSRLARGLAEAGDDVELFTGSPRSPGMAKLLDLWDPFARRALGRTSRRFRPDVVHLHNVTRELSVSVLGVPAGVATVLTVHDARLFGIPDGPAGPFRRTAVSLQARLNRWTARRRVHIAVAVSEDIARRLRVARFREVELVPVFAPPVEPGRPLAETTDIVFAGRLGLDKGVHVLIAAFALLAERHPRARLLIAGDGPDRARLSAAAAPLGDAVTFVGRLSQEDVQRLLAGARAVVVPSIPRLRPEGSPLTIVEAALLARPLVVNDHPTLRQIVDAGGGLAVTPEDPAALCRALDWILSNPEAAARMGEAGRRYALERHTTAPAVTAIRRIYRRAIAITTKERGPATAKGTTK